MKKYLALLLTLAVGMGALAGCGSSSETTTDETQNTETNTEDTANGADTTERTTFTVGFDAEYPPYGYKNEAGEYVGFDLDLATAMAGNWSNSQLIGVPKIWN